MSRPPDSLPAAPRSWLLPAGLTVGVLLLLIAVFWPTFYSMAAVWERSETFAHGYLIFPISAWLVWRMRDELAQLQPQPDLRGLLVMALAGLGWLLADAGSVNVAAQFAFITLLIAAVWTLLGWQVFRALLFPLMFLFFAVPVGEFLIQPLMGVTADFTVAMLQFTGIPVYREGTFFSIPSGDWSVVEGCSGLRYLIASITLGVLYAYLTYRSWQRRLLFTLAAMVVPVFANSGRAYMIVMIAHLSDMKLALGVDHYIYGWVFFGIVMLLLFWIGSFWREDEAPQSTRPAAAPHAAAGSARGRPLWLAGMAVMLVASLWPVYAIWLNDRPLPEMTALQVEPSGGWQPAAAFTRWTPHWVGADRQLRQSFAQAGNNVLLELNYYVTQRQDAELINSQNFMIRQKDPAWSNIGEKIADVTIGGASRRVREARLRGSNGQRLLVWQWNLIDQRPVVNDQIAKLVLAADRVQLKRDDGLSVLIATPYLESEMDAATATLARFAADMQKPIGRALDQVNGQ
ncbi:MAG TPA: exosortase A [Thiobacillus sp.]|nr:MAG: exosortase A [Hydrogenophilales bacterium 28-61-11]OYZ58919.1 MAG: exosortase A [Hydrogenophilales bacterium 16-61-112]OZA46969.1 MAG: exosortase A [Hydrogenophilales bacterium 17-61-76]HQT30390.1 exosortase A [Thiobacillus sp.]HQT68998.1 exosortase A [Thiobacillus sp.]